MLRAPQKLREIASTWESRNAGFMDAPTGSTSKAAYAAVLMPEHTVTLLILILSS